MVLVFDLDDTLYNEVMFVKSGFRAVSEFLYQSYTVPTEDSYLLMVEKLKNGRGRIFDDVLLHFKIFSKKTARKCILIYRSHIPEIELYKDAIECLQRFRNFPIYIVTDGNKLVQKNKLVALGLYDTVKFCFITHRYGVKNAKPSPYCFLKICNREKAQPGDIIYIGDNPHKDFVGIKALGFKTIRIMRGHFKEIVKSEEFEADLKIHSLNELTEEFLMDSLFLEETF